MNEIRMMYFEQDDIVHIAISDEPEAGSVELEPNITVELNAAGELIGIEILAASHFIYAILIPDNVPNARIGDVPTCLSLVEDTPELFVMGTIDIQTQGQAWIKELERLIAQRKIVGMKIFPGHDPIYPTDLWLAPVYALCQATHIPMVIHTVWNSGPPEVAKYNDTKYIVQIAERYPDMKIVIAHYFWPEVDYMIKQLPVTPAVREGIFWHNAVALFNLPVYGATHFP